MAGVLCRLLPHLGALFCCSGSIFCRVLHQGHTASHTRVQVALWWGTPWEGHPTWDQPAGPRPVNLGSNSGRAAQPEPHMHYILEARDTIWPLKDTQQVDVSGLSHDLPFFSTIHLTPSPLTSYCHIIQGRPTSVFFHKSVVSIDNIYSQFLMESP